MANPISLLLLTLALTASGPAGKPAGFDGIACGSDIAAELLGRTMPNERVAALEAKYQAIGLKDLGASEISDNLNLISWQICGSEYMLIEDGKDRVRDVLKAPPHSKAAPLFIGAARVGGKELPATVVAVLKPEDGAKLLSAACAWKIDERQARFVPLPTAGLQCPRDGIITSDGGL
jgi:hypothetical protein